MATCQNCGHHVSERFARVLGTNRDEVNACPDCHTKTRLAEPNVTADRSSGPADDGSVV